MRLMWLLLLAGCAAAPRPHLPTLGRPPVGPYDDPSGLIAGGERGAAVPRVRGWSDEQHLEGIARHVGSDPRVVLGPERAMLTGSASQVDGARRYLADRERFAGEAVLVEAKRERLDPEELPRVDGLWPVGGGITATVATDRRRVMEWLAVLRERRRGSPWAPRVTTFDAQRGELATCVQHAWVGGADGSAGPGHSLPEVLADGLRLRLAPLLAGEGDLACSTWRSRAARSSGSSPARPSARPTGRTRRTTCAWSSSRSRARCAPSARWRSGSSTRCSCSAPSATAGRR